MDAQQKQQIADRLNQSNNILVTVSTNPSVDQLAACIGLTLALNKMGKHAAAVFSGQVPSTIEFLQPEKTIEKTTDSLRDFIIALDKSKADKLRYKVEDKVVKIFITPYKTSISDKDLEFSQGDFNVDVVVALGVHAQTDIDQAITAHGRILHDAVVSTINVAPGGNLGTINWLDPAASSLSELVMRLLKTMNKRVLDGQMATAFLTGIVAETQRFSNNRTSPQTMTISAELMAAGANQQLVATKLEPPKPKPEPKPEPEKPAKPLEATPAPHAAMPKPIGPLAQATEKSTEGTLEIEHAEPSTKYVGSIPSLEQSEPAVPTTPQIDIDHEGTLRRLEELQAKPPSASSNLSEDAKGRKILQPLSTGAPTMTGALSEPTTASDGDGLSLPQPSYGDQDIERPSGAPPLPSADSLTPSPFSPPPATPSASPTSQFAPPPSAPPTAPPSDAGSSFSPQATPPPTDLSSASPSPATDPDHVSNARDAVHQAIGSQPIGSGPMPPIAALNALPVDLNLRGQPAGPTPPGGVVVGPPTNLPPTDSQTDNLVAPPPVPPPMMPPPSQ